MADLPTIKAAELETNPTLGKTVDTETPVKTWLVDYVGTKENPDNGEVTVEMIVETLAAEFPEFVMALAEENWIRGYQQGIHDVEAGRQMAEAEARKLSDESEGTNGD